MPFDVVVRPRFGDTARVTVDEKCRPQLVAELGPGGSWSVQIDDDPGSTELAAQFARELAIAALRFAERCDETMAALASSALTSDGVADGPNA